jgi:hypothetical protein
VRRQWASLVVTILLCGWSTPLPAQSSAASPAADAASIGAWVGLAHNSPGRPFGTSAGNDLTMAAVRLTRTIHESPGWSLDYSADLVPFAVVTTPRDTGIVVVRPCNSSPFGCTFRTPLVEKRVVHGFGGAPFGIQLRLAPRRSVQPFLTASGGALWFREPVPGVNAGRFNFTAEVGAGILLRPTRAFGVTAGYKLQHISNGGTQRSNPGIDNNMFYVGLARPMYASSGSSGAQ